MNTFIAAGPLAAKDFDLAGQWETLWGAITAGAPSLTVILATVGGLLVVISLVTWIWKRRTQRGMGDMTAVWGALIIGALLLAPDVVIPLVLSVLDILVNIVISLAQGIVGD